MRMNAAPGSRPLRTRTLKGFHNAVLCSPFRAKRIAAEKPGALPQADLLWPVGPNLTVSVGFQEFVALCGLPHLPITSAMSDPRTSFRAEPVLPAVAAHPMLNACRRRPRPEQSHPDWRKSGGHSRQILGFAPWLTPLRSPGLRRPGTSLPLIVNSAIMPFNLCMGAYIELLSSGNKSNQRVLDRFLDNACSVIE